MKMSELEK